MKYGLIYSTIIAVYRGWREQVLLCHTLCYTLSDLCIMQKHFVIFSVNESLSSVDCTLCVSDRVVTRVLTARVPLSNEVLAHVIF